VFDVAAATVRLCVVSGALSLHCVGVVAAGVTLYGCYSYHYHATLGVIGAIVTLYGSCPCYASLLLLLLIVGPNGHLRERAAIYISKKGRI